MTPLAISGIALVCVFGGALLGMWLSAALPSRHLSPESRDAVRLGMGLIATISALVLGLVIASAKTSYDAQRGELTRFSADLILLDRLLAHYGPEAKDARQQLRHAAMGALGRMWPAEGSGPTSAEPVVSAESFFDRIQKLAPRDDERLWLKRQAIAVSIDLGRARFLLAEQRGRTVPAAFLVVLVFWLTILFASFGLFAPRNAIVTVTLFASAASVAGAVFLILQLDQPWEGLIQISSEPLRNAVMLLGR